MEEHATLTNISIKINFKGILLLNDFIVDWFASGLYFFCVSWLFIFFINLFIYENKSMCLHDFLLIKEAILLKELERT